MKVYQLQLWGTPSYSPGGVCLGIGNTFANQKDAIREKDRLESELRQEFNDLYDGDEDEDEDFREFNGEFRGMDLEYEPVWYIEEIEIV
jgi:hypothetical protein